MTAFNRRRGLLRDCTTGCGTNGSICGSKAFLHLSHALKLDEDNCEVLSERARCSVDNLQYHFALEDAQQILQRRPDSWLGHVRLAEVYFATFNFEQAAASYQTAFQVQSYSSTSSNMPSW